MPDESHTGTDVPVEAETDVEQTDPRPSKLVQTRVPRQLYDRIERAADTEMISIAGYVRRMLNTYTPGG